MPGMESMGGAFSPRSTRSQKPMMPQSKFNMPRAAWVVAVRSCQPNAVEAAV